MSKMTRDVMTPGRVADDDLGVGSVAADDYVDDALRAMVERHADRLAVVDGREVVGSVTAGALAISIEDARTWSALCK